MNKTFRLGGPSLLLAFLFALFLITSAPSAFGQTGVIGQWSGDSPWPTVGVHLAVLPDGRVATWG